MLIGRVVVVFNMVVRGSLGQDSGWEERLENDNRQFCRCPRHKSPKPLEQLGQRFCQRQTWHLGGLEGLYQQCGDRAGMEEEGRVTLGEF